MIGQIVAKLPSLSKQIEKVASSQQSRLPFQVGDSVLNFDYKFKGLTVMKFATLAVQPS